MYFYLLLTLSLVFLRQSHTAPLPSSSSSSSNESSNRMSKNLYYDYIPGEYNNYELDESDETFLDENDLSRTLQQSGGKSPPPIGYNSPIYYIRLPPQPYMYVPGLGYMPSAPPSSISHLLNLPVSFVSNGKPSTIYQWNGGLGSFPTVQPSPPQQKPPLRDSIIHRLPGQYTFNGKPEDIFVLRDSYNSLYGDALQNFYP